MRASAVLVSLLAAACGRLGFDAVPDAPASLGVLGQPSFLKASNPGVGDLFGYSVAMSSDRNTLAVGGARVRGSALVATR